MRSRSGEPLSTPSASTCCSDTRSKPCAASASSCAWTSAISARSAVERIGGVREGVLRKAEIPYDGHESYVVLFSMTDDEWPARKAWFERTPAR